jgi:Phosphotransferase enzyme family
MDDRYLLGLADVSDRYLAGMVETQVGCPVHALRSCEVDPVAYDIPALTTLGRWWVRGDADTASGPAPYAFFVKHVQSWSRSPIFQQVPEAYRAMAARDFPWRTEGCVYRSDLSSRLPEGLRMPRAYGVQDIDDESYALWLEAVPAAAVEWTPDRSARAAYLLGRLAASPAVAPLARVGDFPFRFNDYLSGRLAMQVLPILRSDVWDHPAVAAAFDDELRARVLASLDRLADWAAEADALPVLTGHGDAAPNNLLVAADDPNGFVLIDYGLWNALPVGFDLGQLLVGDVAIGRRPAATLAETEAVIVPAYVEGLRVEGCDIDEATVRRAHAIQVYLFNGVSALPFEMLDTLPPEALSLLAGERAALTRFCLDLLEPRHDTA